MPARNIALALLYSTLASGVTAHQLPSTALHAPQHQTEPAQQEPRQPSEEESVASSVAIDGLSAPQPPEVISRDAAGRVTVRAVRVHEALSIDGRLEEAVYQEVPPLSDFIQVEPDAGAPATEDTEAWVFFDDDNLYISARAWDSAPESEWVANEMRRDNFNVL
ncbi:MAG: hypothetical protein VX453_10085, partial [Acidobacteriota bacterium]|nr:hypothetical protein [Acidobacteriota bacterium]